MLKIHTKLFLLGGVFLFISVLWFPPVTLADVSGIQTAVTDGSCEGAYHGNPAFGNNKVFLTYMTNCGGAHEIVVKQYDFVTTQWTTSPTLSSISPACCDEHDAPIIYRDPNGYIDVIYGSIYAGNYNPPNTGPFYRRSIRPDDITAWGPEQRIPNLGGISENYGGFTPNGSLHIFGQQQWTVPGGLPSYDLIYARRDANLNWATPVSLVHDDGKDDAANSGTLLKVGPGCPTNVTISGDTIYLVWSSSVDGCAGSGENIYFAKSTDNGDTWTNANGTASFSWIPGLAAIAPLTYPTQYLVRTGNTSYDRIPGALKDGTMLIVDRDPKSGLNLLRWNGSSWALAQTIDSTVGGGSWGMTFNVLSDDTLVVVVSNNGSSINEYVSTDQGATWSKTILYTLGSEGATRKPGSIQAVLGGRDHLLIEWTSVYSDHREVKFLDREFGVALGTTPVTPPGVSCGTLDQSSTLTQGFGSPMNFFTNPAQQLFQIYCNPATTPQTFTAYIPKPSSLQLHYTYTLGYQWNTTTKQWESFTYSCSLPLVVNAWCPGTATKQLDATKHNVISYSCSYVNNAWKCGCRDAACATAYWQLQRF